MKIKAKYHIIDFGVKVNIARMKKKNNLFVNILPECISVLMPAVCLCQTGERLCSRQVHQQRRLHCFLC